jgi:3'-phosphoadenosine 5'-phosphosulfate sulfotransferase
MNNILTTEEWEAALQEAMTPTEAPEGWKTVAELAKTMNVSTDAIRHTLGAYKAKDRLLVQWVHRIGISGKRCKCPVYALKPGERPS